MERALEHHSGLHGHASYPLQHEEARRRTLARLVGGKAQGEKKKGLLTSGVLCAGVAATDPGVLESGVLGEIGFRFRALSALRASLCACTAQP